MAPESQVSGNDVNLSRERHVRERKKVTRDKNPHTRRAKTGGDQAIEETSKESNLSKGQGKENFYCGQIIKTCNMAWSF